MTHYSATSLEQIADELERLAGEADNPILHLKAVGLREAATLVRNTRLADPAMEAMVKALEAPTGDLADILGQPCFKFIQLAQLWRSTGTDIETQAEAEQAFFIGRMLTHYFTDAEAWREKWADEVEARIKLAKDNGHV